MRSFSSSCVLFFSILFLFSCTALKKQNSNQGTWVFVKSGDMRRGGTTRGPSVKRDLSVSTYWKKLKSKKNTYEKDRAAILALQGEFKTQFEFIETVVFDNKTKKDIPYTSWGTEFVKVIEERKDFISLQHIMVMSFYDKKTGKLNGPFVMKHWRQDWQWRGKEVLTYMGNDEWKKQKVDNPKNHWVWQVYQVDDSPRYGGVGRWDHRSNLSVFRANNLSRPLPRRERSVRSDYTVLDGEDTIILTPNAWFHEQKNFKRNSKGRILSREIGHNSYLRIKDYDFNKGKDYWVKSSNYWKEVRNFWEKELSRSKGFVFKRKVKKEFLFAKLFQQAGDPNIQILNPLEKAKIINRTIKPHVKFKK